VVWNSVTSKVTIPGRPVGIKMVGNNVVMVLQFTPFLRPEGSNILVAQGQIWVEAPEEGMRYQTTLQTIPIEFGEPIFFFPLGAPDSLNEARIELQLVLRPYGEADRARERERIRGRDRDRTRQNTPEENSANREANQTEGQTVSPP
ncbi:MAG: hypothetical protein LBT39_10770, partial [Treponema sp.]|jgi:hypothetical protein|nr:hypothetical protein [Treponema sp.]